MKSYSYASGKYDRTIVVGDIHGCYAEFQELCRLVNFGAGDALVSVGDFLDRGPDSWEVAAFFRDLPNAFSVLGNHERRVAGTIRGTSKPAWSQQQTLSLLPKAEWNQWAGFLEQLPAVFETDHVLITHARLDPARPIREQDPYFTAAVGGSTVQIDLDSDGVPRWFAEISPMMKKPVCMGHIGYSRVELVPGRLYALDTRAVGGGCLSAAIFPGGSVVHVAAAKNYYEEAFAAWKKRELVAGDPLDWPLPLMLDILEPSDESEDSAIYTNVIKARAALAALPPMPDMHRLVSRFGPLPPAGPERGNYFKMLRSILSSRELEFIIHRVLSGQNVTIEEIANRFRNLTLARLCEILNRL
ncbi:MAG: metallophosphoesterase [Acidobacteriota bacterium]|jgi:serine/threonine protein phosphatase 1